MREPRVLIIAAVYVRSCNTIAAQNYSLALVVSALVALDVKRDIVCSVSAECNRTREEAGTTGWHRRHFSFLRRLNERFHTSKGRRALNSDRNSPAHPLYTYQLRNLCFCLFVSFCFLLRAVSHTYAETKRTQTPRCTRKSDATATSHHNLTWGPASFDRLSTRHTTMASALARRTPLRSFLAQALHTHNTFQHPWRFLNNPRCGGRSRGLKAASACSVCARGRAAGFKSSYRPK